MPNNKLNLNELRQLQAYYRQAPALFRRAGVKYINLVARELQTAIQITLQRKFELRAERFVNSSVRIENMRRSDGRAIVGTIKRPRFSGMEESESGGETMDNQFSLNARGGSFGRRSSKKSRLSKGKKIYNQGNFPVRNRAGNQEKRANQMLSVYYKEKIRDPFIMRGHRDISDGLFIFKNQRLHRLRYFERRKTIKHVPWMEDSIALADRTHNARRAWQIAIKRVGGDQYKRA
ncbi:hypothetical protein GWN42_31180 [candidate division KSB1 bacterium]|nr:hypothetical protein [Phycisphaerae bacterium]NIQ92522.1 hypothetical protein [Deltaproteobacteria bacterium]NIV97132.1 hypothetical protein [candidate division KSB1 bacterium]